MKLSLSLLCLSVLLGCQPIWENEVKHFSYIALSNNGGVCRCEYLGTWSNTAHWCCHHVTPKRGDKIVRVLWDKPEDGIFLMPLDTPLPIPEALKSEAKP